MESDRVRSAISLMMRFGCYFRIYPYGWDPLRFRLTKASRVQEIGYNLRVAMMMMVFSFITFRCVQTVKDEMPPRLRVMNFIWSIAYGLSCVSDLQFILRREEIMFFGNSLFQEMERRRKPWLSNEVTEEGNAQRFGKTVGQHENWNWNSIILLISSSLLYTNPQSHAMVLWFGPCTPAYISSVFHNCSSYTHIPLTMMEAIPYVGYEYITVATVMYIWTFNWTLIFLGFLWIKEILGGISPKSGGESGGDDDEWEKYRFCQVLVRLIDDGFEFYLQWFPSVLFTVAGMLLFCCIKYTNLNLLLYLVFPFCGLRCLFEAVTAIAAAGYMNQASSECLDKWGKMINLIEGSNERKYMVAFHKSCPVLKCSAGAMYTFENSIVLVSLHHCTQLTFNMLVSFE